MTALLIYRYIHLPGTALLLPVVNNIPLSADALQTVCVIAVTALLALGPSLFPAAHIRRHSIACLRFWAPGTDLM